MSSKDQGRPISPEDKEQGPLFYQPRLHEGIRFLDEEEAHHARVLRFSPGDKISVTDGKGLLCDCVISGLDKRSVSFDIVRQSNHKRPTPIHLFVAPTKNSDRIEWLVEKAAEIGVWSVTMVRCRHSERKQISHDRLVKMAISAMKQSRQAWLPDIGPLTSFDEIIRISFDQNFIAFVDHSNPDQLKDLARPGKTYGLLIGPEGDFTTDEIQLAIANNWQKVSLGKTRLRTETAALVGVLTLVLANS